VFSFKKKMFRNEEISKSDNHTRRASFPYWKRVGSDGRDMKKKHVPGTIDQLQPNERGILVHARQVIRRAIRHRRQSDTVWPSQRCVQTLATMARKGIARFVRLGYFELLVFLAKRWTFPFPVESHRGVKLRRTLCRVPKDSKNTWTTWWSWASTWSRKSRVRRTNSICCSSRKWLTSAFGTCRSVCGTSRTRRTGRNFLDKWVPTANACTTCNVTLLR